MLLNSFTCSSSFIDELLSDIVLASYLCSTSGTTHWKTSHSFTAIYVNSTMNIIRI